MSDLHPIKDILSSLLSYMKSETWYISGGIFCLYILYVLYMKMWQRYQESLVAGIEEPAGKESFREKLETLRTDDSEFYEKISLLLKHAIEQSGKIQKATKKTKSEIYKELPSKELSNILTVCEQQIYAKGGYDINDRMVLKDSVRELLVKLEQ